MVSFNRWSIDNHRKAVNQEPTQCVRMERRHGESGVSCPSTQQNVPGQGSNAGFECSNHEATARVKLNELRWINSPIEWKFRQTNQNGGLTVCWFSFVVMPGPVRKEMQVRWYLFQNRCFSSLTLWYKYFRIFSVHLQIAFWNDFLYHLIRSLYLVNIGMTGVYSGIQWNISIYLLPTNLGTWRPKYTLNPFFSKRPNKWIGVEGEYFNLRYSVFRCSPGANIPIPC